MIAIINESTVVTDAEVQQYMSAYQIQVNRDFGPVWGQVAHLQFFTKGQAPPTNAWQLVFLDNSDQAGAAGYHDVTASGHPLSKIFAKTTLDAGMSVSVDGSHELLEMLADPGIQRAAMNYDNNGNLTSLYAWEVADACEDDQYGYDIGGVLVSDFVYPSWFGGLASTKFDFCGHITTAGQILTNGYIGAWTPTGGWNQVMGAARRSDYRSIPAIGSRNERRFRGQPFWVPSTAHSAAS